MALSGMRSRDLYGVDLSLRREATVSDFMFHERQVRRPELHARATTRGLPGDGLSRSRLVPRPAHPPHADHPQEQAQGEHTEQATTDNGHLLRGEKILIATGSFPVRPSAVSVWPRSLDSDTILELEPAAIMAVVGAGTIGSEYACIFAALGTEVLSSTAATTPAVPRQRGLARPGSEMERSASFSSGRTV